ncbi:MAG: methylated-DNA--[protein]-cysteine S-methyltransferase [Spirochaetaceae bacterium]|jgi:methylated-DNA-[protein]-cysteine S-methyltransferase|nr:methylated-DNA--[protein]-cysteine S-methyltransferase [Spirochaetaceae bacterium]
MIYTCTINSPLGVLRASAEDASLTGLRFPGQKYFPLDTDTWIEEPDYPVFQSLRNWLDQYFAGENPRSDIPLAPRGTPFRQGVWKCLADIPYGETRTYSEIAEQARCRSPQAVGGAIARNPIALLVPCHRVIGSDGSLIGYAGGLDKKEALLQIEQTRSRAVLAP